ncbi:MAG: sigma 54-interacting transcriptional regulator [Tissierellia bacterium]|nr:sigma 54-interacting transcriptional regulator [Tissierellia bacterium]
MIDQNGFIVKMNKAYANFLGIEIVDAIGEHVTEIIENTRLHIVIETGISEIGQIQWINGHESITSRIPLFNNGKIIGAVGMVIFRNSMEVNMLYKKIKEANIELDNYKERLRRVQKNYLAIDDIIGNNSKIIKLKNTIKRVATSDSTILITGESGTGKEVFANAIHEMSNRRDNKFVKVNCAAIPETILESELFGYEEGAFTGAKKGGKIGKFELANQGTIFLDEIGDMGMNMQSKLLRVLQEKVVDKVGGSKPINIDVRIIAATNQNLIEKINKGSFREDLYFRLNVIPIEIPPLRERLDDIPVLCEYFIKQFNYKFGIYIEKIEDEAMEYLKNYSWPGNIRELENVIERAYNFVDSNIITKEQLPEKITKEKRYFYEGDLNNKLNNYEKNIIFETLEMCGGNKSKTARILGISRANLYQKLKKYE